jgi:hypothetical protein
LRKKVGKNPTERRKYGTKRNVLTEGGGGPIGLAVKGANRHDFKMVWETSENIPIKRPAPTLATPQRTCLDKGCEYGEVRDLLANFGCTAHIRARGEEAKMLQRGARFRA